METIHIAPDVNRNIVMKNMVEGLGNNIIKIRFSTGKIIKKRAQSVKSPVKLGVKRTKRG